MIKDDSPRQGLNMAGQIHGISLESFLQMVQMERKTCSIKVSTDHDLGFLHLKDGELIAAETSELEGELAAHKIIGWDDSNLEIDKSLRKISRNIDKPLMSVLMNSLSLRDEKHRTKREKAPEKPQGDAKELKISRYLKIAGKYAAEENIDSATKILFEVIVELARDRQFTRAEEVREKLQSIAPMALNEIINSAEVIEEEKSKAVDRVHLQIWSKLYKSLSKEEANNLYHSMKVHVFPPGKLLFRQGALNSRLFFLDSGEVALYYSKGKKNILIRKMASGSIIGDESFFSITSCTVSVRTMTRAKVHYLDRSMFEKLSSRFQSLNSKLTNYCLNLEKSSYMISQKNLERREHHRYKISGRVTIKILSITGAPTRVRFRATLADISRGGIAAQVTISKPETARALLGRPVNVVFELNPDLGMGQPSQNGVIIAVIDHFFNNYVLSVKFDDLISQGTIKEMARFVGHMEPNRR